MTNAARNTRKLGWLLPVAAGLLLGAALVSGCDDEVFRHDCGDPLAPVNVNSITGDGEVYLYWTPVDEDNVDYFVVYRSSTAYGTYYEIGHTSDVDFLDRDTRNGRTYFYAVTSVDYCGHESELSREIVHDTPRPEGFGASVADADGEDWRRSGWDFSAYRALPWDHTDADVYFIVSDGVPYLVAVDLDTDIQDAGFAGFDDVSWAPENGWSPSGVVEVIRGHVYVVWTRNDHYAKVRVTSVGGGTLRFDWAYQVDRGNPELAPRPPRENAPLSVVPSVRSEG
jgi:hypothetical protein